MGDLISKLNPYKVYAEAGLFLVLVLCFMGFIHHERQIGAKRVEDAVKVEADRQKAINEKVEADATATISELQSRLADAYMHPPADPIHVRVCGPAYQVPATRNGPGPGQGSDASGGPSGGVAPDASSQEGPDIGPETDAQLARLGAKISYLQGYIRACQKEGLCKQEK